MANYANLKAALNAAIYTNTQRAITGDILNAKMDEMINALGAGYQYMGEATPSTNPGSPDSNVVYLATTAGTYTNFGGFTLANGKIAFLRWNGTWAKDEISVQAELTIDSQPTSGSTNPVASGGVFTALSGKQQTISSVNVTVDNNTGTPSATASVSGGTMTMAFTNLKGAKGDTGATGATGATGPQGPKGDQGDPGSSVDYPFTLANNLTETDSTKALAAPQGKVLDDKISQLGLEVGEKNYPLESGAINYLNGNDAVNTKAVRTGHIPIYQNTDIAFTFPKEVYDTYIVKYLNGTYAGYQKIEAYYYGKKITVTADNTFNTVRFRVSAATDWTEDDIAASSCDVVYPGSTGESVANLQDEVSGIKGKSVEFEMGGINYLTGVILTDAKSIRSKGYTSVISDLIIRITSTVAFNGWLVKYNDFVYAGYEAFTIAANGVVDIPITKDSTFNSVKFRLSRDTTVTQEQLDGVDCNKLIPNDYTDLKAGEVEAKLYITPALHAGYYVHKDDGKLRKASGWYYSDFIEVEKLGKFEYSFYGAQSASICGYDAEMNFVSALIYGIGSHEGVFTLSDARIKYVRGCTNNTSFYVIRAIKPYITAQDYSIGCQSVFLQSEDKRAAGFLSVESRQVENKWLKLTENYSLPTDGIYLGRIGDDVYLAINGTLKKLN